MRFRKHNDIVSFDGRYWRVVGHTKVKVGPGRYKAVYDLATAFDDKTIVRRSIPAKAIKSVRVNDSTADIEKDPYED